MNQSAAASVVKGMKQTKTVRTGLKWLRQSISGRNRSDRAVVSWRRSRDWRGRGAAKTPLHVISKIPATHHFLGRTNVEISIHRDPDQTEGLPANSLAQTSGLFLVYRHPLTSSHCFPFTERISKIIHFGRLFSTKISTLELYNTTKYACGF